MTHPHIASKRGKKLADQLQKNNQPLVIHVISASCGPMICTLDNMNSNWRDKYVRAVVFDSSPVPCDVHTAGAGIAFLLKRNNLKPYLSPLFYPYFFLSGMTDEYRTQHDRKMFGHLSVIPRNSGMLFLYGRNDPVMNYEYLQKFISDQKNLIQTGLLLK